MKKLNLFAPINTLGYGVVATNILKTFYDQDIDIALALIGSADAEAIEPSIIQECVNKYRVFDNFNNAPCLKIWHEFDLAQRVGAGPYFAFPFFEINQLDQKRINHLSSVDGIIVASEWAKEVIANANISVPVEVAPLGVDRSTFYPQQSNNDKCTFLNCGKWEKRKGHDILLEMFRTAFPNERDVELHMMPFNVFLSATLRSEWERYYQSDARVKILDRVPSPSHVANIMGTADCGIFPSRAEGWNLELLEMMSMGKHIITTFYSAHTQFCNNKNSNLIEIFDLEPADDGIFFNGSSGQWASLEGKPFKQGVEYLRDFYTKWKSGNISINQEGMKTAASFSWTNTTKKIEEAIYGYQSAEVNQVGQNTQ